MKIAVFYNLAFGGAKRVVLEHVRGLKKNGHSVDLYTTNSESDAFDPSPIADNFFSYTISLESSVPVVKRLIKDYKNFFVLKNLHRKIASDINTRGYDVVLVHPDKFTQAPFLLRFLKAPSVYYCQEPLRIVYEYSMRLRENVHPVKRIYEEVTRLYRRRIDRENVRAARLTIASCYHIRERMIESYEVFPKVVYCAVDHTVFRPIKIKKKNQVFYVGSPNVIEDGYDLAKKAIQCIPARIRPKLHVVSWKKANGERLSEQELVKIYNHSLVTLCTSRLETFGLVPLESMACGVPVIATKISGHRETVKDNKTGFLVEFEPEEIAEKITTIIHNKKLAKEMGNNARGHIEKLWSWDKHIKNLELVLRRTL